MDESASRSLIERATNQLCAVDSPNIETLKMQVEVEGSLVSIDEEQQQQKEDREGRLREMVDRIVRVDARVASDFDSLSALYREVRSLIYIFCSLSSTTI